MSTGRLVNAADARLREWLKSQSLKAGMRLPSERSLAAQLQLQHYALNRAMARLIAEGSVERDGYKLFLADRHAVTEPLLCHLVVARRSIHLPGYKRVAKEMGVRLEIHHWQSTEEAVLALDHLDRPDTEAIVFDPPYVGTSTGWEAAVNRLRLHDIPVVCINQSSPDAYSVTGDGHQDLQHAVSHLHQIGHRELAFISSSAHQAKSPTPVELWQALCSQHHLDKSRDRILLQKSAPLRSEAHDLARKFTNEWSDVTGLVFGSGMDYNIQLLLDQLDSLGRAVPGKLSLIFVGGDKSPALANPPVTTIAPDMALMQETAFHLAQRAVRKRKAHGLLPSPCRINIQSQFTLRQSTRPLPDATATNAADRSPPNSAAPGGPTPSHARPGKPYSLAIKASLSERRRFAPVDLGRLVNRPLNFRRGWLGDLPLKQLPPGPREIHGVPFNILGGPRRSDGGVIVFHSEVNTVGNAKFLPDKLTIPIGAKAAAIYVLHGCGYARALHQFARYRFFSGKTRLGEVPLVALGQPSPGLSPAGQSQASPNIQDWWPDYPHMDFAPESRMVPLLEESGGDLERHVYLYTYEWINPHPRQTVDALEVTVDPSASTTLGILAITVLAP